MVIKDTDKLAHDLKTPLSTIRGYVAMLLEGVYGEPGPKIREAIEKIGLASDKLACLLEEFFPKK